MNIFLAHVAAPYTQEELFEFVAELSWLTLSSWTVRVYWPSILVLIASALVTLRSRNGVWLAPPTFVLALQQSLRLLELFAGYEHHPWLLREFVSVALSHVVIGLPLVLLVCLGPKFVYSRSAKLVFGSSVLALLTVLLDWAFFLLFVSPVGGVSR